MSFDVYLLYAFVGFACAITIGIVRNRVRKTIYKESIDNKFCGILLFFIIFCVVDAIWGIIGSPVIWPSSSSLVAYYISTYAFHFFAFLSSFLCSYYGIYYLLLNKKEKRGFNIFRAILMVAQPALIIQNFFTGLFFTIDANGIYHSNVLRPLSFYLQFCHYIPLIIFALIKAIKCWKKKENAYVYISGMFFLAIPLFFGLLQMFYPDGSFYSLGFMVTSVAIYSINVTKQREDYLRKYHTMVEQEKSREKIEEALILAKKANAAKSEFLANMSHDIRTPINGIMGMVYLAKKEDMSPKLVEYINNIDKSSQHLLSLINDVLDMSAIESGEASLLHKESMNVVSIIDNCNSIIRGQVGTKNLKYICNFNNVEHSSVLGDDLRLRQIFINILGNAIKFTPQDGSITFDVQEEKVEDGKVYFKFSISDTGIGMKEEFIEHLFEPFKQENNASRSNYVGTGLGMAISKQLTELMGGTISVKSKLNEGTTFFVNIPFEIDTKENNSKIDEISNEQCDFSGKKLLFVEDNEINTQIGVEILQGVGFEITTAGDGQIAVDTFAKSEENYFDVILMDVMMPNLNGYEATKKIRALERTDAKSVPIIAMTANAFEEDRKNAIESGMNAHVSKPIDYKILFKEISTYLKK